MIFEVLVSFKIVINFISAPNLQKPVQIFKVVSNFK